MKLRIAGVVSLSIVGRSLAAVEADDTSRPEMVNAGSHRLYTLCTGPWSNQTVILIDGFAAGLDVWKAVQSSVEKFSSVCSYDRAGDGRSDKIGRMQTPDEVVHDL